VDAHHHKPRAELQVATAGADRPQRQLSPHRHPAIPAETSEPVKTTGSLVSFKSNKINNLEHYIGPRPRGTARALLSVRPFSFLEPTLRMSHQLVIDLSRQAIMTALMIAAPMLLIALGVGLVVSIIQSVTQIQEQTLSFVPKLVLVGGAFIVGLPWLMQILIRYTTELFRGIPAMVG
jgi:flagellar biosynthetic protein FliQ